MASAPGNQRKTRYFFNGIFLWSLVRLAHFNRTIFEFNRKLKMSGLTSNTDHTCTITASNIYGQIKNFRAKKIFKTLEGPPSKPTNINVTGKTGFTHSKAGSPLWSHWIYQNLMLMSWQETTEHTNVLLWPRDSKMTFLFCPLPRFFLPLWSSW